MPASPRAKLHSASRRLVPPQHRYSVARLKQGRGVRGALQNATRHGHIPMFATSPDWVSYNRRVQLLQAAWDFLVAEDVSELKVNRLARDLGVSHQSAYQQFSSKTELLAALAGAGLATLIVNIDGPSEPSVEEFVLSWLKFAAARPRHYLLMFSMEAGTHPGVELRHEGLRRQIRDLCFRERGAEPDEAAVLTIFSLLHGAASLVAAGSRFPSVPTLVEATRSSLTLQAPGLEHDQRR